MVPTQRDNHGKSGLDYAIIARSLPMVEAFLEDREGSSFQVEVNFDCILSALRRGSEDIALALLKSKKVELTEVDVKVAWLEAKNRSMKGVEDYLANNYCIKTFSAFTIRE